MKKVIYIIAIVFALGAVTSCAHQLCPAYGPQHGK